MPIAKDSKTESALDLLEGQDRKLDDMFERIDHARGTSVEDRAEYGTLAKLALREVAVREAALVDISNAMVDIPAVKAIREQLEEGLHRRRQVLDRAEKMSRGVQGMYLNTGRDFDVHFRELEHIIRCEIEWDLTVAIPAVRAVSDEELSETVHTAEHVARHAPTNLDPSQPRWYEGAPIISRLLTLYTHMRDFPLPARKDREKQTG